MKATLQMIADYDGHSKTYGVYLIADEQAVLDSGIEDGDEVEVRKVATADQPRNRNRAYLAGPMTGHVDYNYAAFHLAAAYYREMGVDIVSPAELHGDDFGKTFEEYLAVDLAALYTCGTIILLLGWQDSRGAKVELCSAIEHGLDIRLCASIMEGRRCKQGEERNAGAIERKRVKTSV
jgi:hypothetical protein